MAKSSIDLPFPEIIGDAQRGPIVDYENNGNPGLGYSTAYHGAGWTATVYCYNGGLEYVDPDPRSPMIGRELLNSIDSVVRSHPTVFLEQPFLICDNEMTVLFVAIVLSFVDGAQTAAVCLSSWQGNFIKIRLTATEPADMIALTDAFATTYARTIGQTR